MKYIKEFNDNSEEIKQDIYLCFGDLIDDNFLQNQDKITIEKNCAEFVVNLESLLNYKELKDKHNRTSSYTSLKSNDFNRIYDYFNNNFDIVQDIQVGIKRFKEMRDCDIIFQYESDDIHNNKPLCYLIISIYLK